MLWVTNLGRAELVRIPYYGHIGYLCRKRWKIRATNGNSPKYGDFGCVTKVLDLTEVPQRNCKQMTQLMHLQMYLQTEVLMRAFLQNAGREYVANPNNFNCR